MLSGEQFPSNSELRAQFCTAIVICRTQYIPSYPINNFTLFSALHIFLLFFSFSNHSPHPLLLLPKIISQSSTLDHHHHHATSSSPAQAVPPAARLPGVQGCHDPGITQALCGPAGLDRRGYTVSISMLWAQTFRGMFSLMAAFASWSSSISPFSFTEPSIH